MARVLVVDDDEKLRHALTQNLTREGHEVPDESAPEAARTLDLDLRPPRSQMEPDPSRRISILSVRGKGYRFVG